MRIKPNCMDAPGIWFKAMQLYSRLPKKLRDIVWPIAEANSYWLHAENLLVAMFGDIRRWVRQKAADLLLGNRMNPYQPEKPKSGLGSDKKGQNL